ncbi:WD40 repeat domain-containing protein [Allopusillimonas ginsengisoli]|uniref:WD40 repeat domain-containing protein n=1 Tax=Allopusillimonas ginsengisoli TaxID=453575 RepID=UPI0039C4BDF6
MKQTTLPINSLKTLVLWLLLYVLACGISHAQMPFPTQTESEWRLEDSPSALASRTPRGMRTPVLIMGQNREVASYAVVILVNASYNAVSPLVAQAWKQQGHQVEDAALALADLPEAWRQMMLAAQPNLRAALVKNVYTPELAQAVKDGALTDNERTRRLRLLGASMQASSDILRKTSEFQKQTQRMRYQREQQFGKHHRTDDYEILNVEPVLGRPATAITIQRRHSLRNPPSLALADTPQFQTQLLVPAAEFQAALNAITEALPNAAIRLAESPEVWIPSVPMPDTLPAPKWRIPTEDGRQIKPTIRTFRTTDSIELQAVRPQTDGSLIIGVERLISNDTVAMAIAELWRLVPDATEPQVLWQGMSGADKLVASPDGKQLWFTGQELDGQHDSLFHYTQEDGLVRINFPAGKRPRLDTAQWWIDEQGPIMASYSVGTLQRLGNLTLSSPQPVPRVQWFFNDLRLLPGGTHPWVDDDQGVAELNPQTGRVLRSIAVPPRVQAPPGLPHFPYLDPRAARTYAPGVASAKGKWLATAFRLDDQSSGHSAGVHVLDTDKAALLYSAVLPDADQVRLVAASPDGRWLAVHSYGRNLVLWDVRAGTNPLHLLVPHVTLSDLTFSLDSNRLIGVGNEHVLTWPLSGK